MTGAWRLLKSLRGTSHAALVADILDAVRHGALAPPKLPVEELSPGELLSQISNCMTASCRSVSLKLRLVEPPMTVDKEVDHGDFS